MARDIKNMIDDGPAYEFFAFLNMLKKEDVPLTLIQGTLWEHRLGFATGREPKLKIKISWSDDSGEPGSFDQLLLPEEAEELGR